MASRKKIGLSENSMYFFTKKKNTINFIQKE